MVSVESPAFLGNLPSSLSMSTWNLVPARRDFGALCKTSGARSKGVKSVPLASQEVFYFYLEGGRR